MLLYNQDDYNTNVNSSLIASLPKRKMGVAARLSYDYDHRYMLEVNAATMVLRVLQRASLGTVPIHIVGMEYQ